jgi:toluene monooxygenase system ferredoxin subunit
MLAVTAGGVHLMLCNVGGEVFAFDDRCPHQANPLSRGTLEDHVLTCAAHEWVFDVRNGHGVNPENACLRAYPVRLDGDTILVNVGPVDG